MFASGVQPYSKRGNIKAALENGKKKNRGYCVTHLRQKNFNQLCTSLKSSWKGIQLDWKMMKLSQTVVYPLSGKISGQTGC